MKAADCLLHLPPQHAKIWDGTLGLGGHSLALRSAYASAQIFASDADAEMLSLARERLGDEHISYAHANFSENPFADEAPFGFIFLDLGISSAHFDHFERGFSFRFDQPLDMRLDIAQKKTAGDIVMRSSEEVLARIFFDYGEEKYARRIAHEIVVKRKSEPIETTRALAEICAAVYPPKYLAKGHAQRHPATRVFQALRIAVNGELDALEIALQILPDALCIGGRLALITFHSLEDRLVKHAFRARAQIRQSDPLARSNFTPGNFKEVDRGGVVPSDAEISENPRARSARLRVIERVR